jgi:lipopolysaccharide transport system ATP-binding protein
MLSRIFYLVDEILSVGDLSFRNKALRKMHEYHNTAAGLIFISHDLEQIRNLCQRTMLIKNGSIIQCSTTHDIIVQYEEIARLERKQRIPIITNFIDTRNNISSENEILIKNLGFININGIETDELDINEPILFFCNFVAQKDFEELFFYFSIRDETNKQLITVISNNANKSRYLNIERGEYHLQVYAQAHHLSPGIYIPSLGIRNGATFETYQKILSESRLHIKSDGIKTELAPININETWKLIKK